MRLLPVLTSPDRVGEFKEYRRYFRIIPDKVLENVYERVFSAKVGTLLRRFLSYGETLGKLSETSKLKYIKGLERHDRNVLLYLLLSVDKRFWNKRDSIARMFGYSDFHSFRTQAIRSFRVTTGLRVSSLRTPHLRPEDYSVFWSFTVGYIGLVKSGYIMGFHLGDGSIKVRNRGIEVIIDSSELRFLKPIVDVLKEYNNSYRVSRYSRAFYTKPVFRLHSEDTILQSLCFLWGYYYAIRLGYEDLAMGLLVGMTNADGHLRVRDRKAELVIYQDTERVEEIPLVNEAIVVLHELAYTIGLEHSLKLAYPDLDLTYRATFRITRRHVLDRIVKFAMDKGLPIKIPSKIIEKILE